MSGAFASNWDYDDKNISSESEISGQSEDFNDSDSIDEYF
jgi:hypothetical protein